MNRLVCTLAVVKGLVLGVLTAALLILILTIMEGSAGAQPVQNVAVVPECQIFLSTDGAALPANSVSWDNRSKACDRWIVTYSIYGFAGPISLAVQSSADNAGVPAAWVNFAGTVVSGVNPNVAATQALTSLSGFYPWMKMTLTATGAGAGRLTATLYGYKDRPASVAVAGLVNMNLSQYGGVAVGAANAIHVQGTAAAGAAPVGNPSRIGGLASGAAGGLMAEQTVCDLSAAVTLAAAGATEIVAAVAGRSIRVCHLSVSMQAPVDISLVRGTGANCAVGTANVTGVYSTALALSMDYVNGPVIVTAANALCVNLGAAVTGGGLITYAVY